MAETGLARLLQVEVDGELEEISVDERGPKVLRLDGSVVPYNQERGNISIGLMVKQAKRGWADLSSTERKIIIHIAAKQNRRMKERLGLTTG
mmetsp:Transcript_19412/g.44161  ORF Transcript_19412/g.44161 Transcript_19412/m.44161 type:complete len:92 (+) Transcript_19412:81-356(+)